MSGQHTLRREPIRLRIHIRVHVPWRAIGVAFLEIADVLWKCAVAGIVSLLLAAAIALIAKGFYENGEPSAAVLTVIVGFGIIVAVLITWAQRESRKVPPRRGEPR